MLSLFMCSDFVDFHCSDLVAFHLLRPCCCASGLHYPRSRTDRQQVDPIAVTTYDWMHTLLQGGVLNEEVEALLTEAGPFGITRKAIQEFLRDQPWQFPQCSRAKSKQLHRIFDVKRQSDKDPDKLRCSCAEALGVYGLLRFFLETAIGGEAGLHNHMASFGALCGVLDTSQS
jgi:hypothetical protein